MPIQYVRTFIYVHNALLHIECAHILGTHKHKKHLYYKHYSFIAYKLLNTLPVLIFQILRSLHSVFVCFVWITEHMAVIPLHKIN